MDDISGLNNGESNPGGLLAVLFIDVADVVSIPDGGSPTGDRDIADRIDLSAIVFKPGKQFLNIGYTIDSAAYREEEIEDAHGNRFKQSVVCSVPKEYNFRHQNFDDMENRQYVVLLSDFSFNYILLFSRNRQGELKGMQFKRHFDTGVRFADKVVYAPVFYGELPHSAYRGYVS